MGDIVQDGHNSQEVGQSTQQTPDTIQELPQVGMKFDSEDELHVFYKKYAYQTGFGVRTSSTRRESNTKYYALECSKGGTYVCRTESNTTRLSSKTDCKAKVSVIVYGDGRCTISRVFLEHNHVLSPRKSRFQRSHNKLDSYSKRRLELNDSAGIPLCKNFHLLVVEAQGYENLAFDERDCRNFIAKARQLRLGTGDAEALRDYFVRMQRRSPNFYYVIDMDDEGRLRNVFWVDPRSRAAYESFGDVVSFDSTYLTNKYDMPFAPFVGVNHHRQSILFGCGLLSSEDKETYAWLFNSWLECMNGRSPKTIITDQCRSMKAAVAKVFPESHHRLCLWHIMKKIPKKLNGYTQYKAIYRTLKILVYESIEPQEFEDGWSKMIEDYNLEKNEWLSSLFDERKHWVPVYVKIIFWAGMSPLKEVKVYILFFDGYVNSKTTLRQFVEQYHNALKSKMEKESKADFASQNSSYKLLTGLCFEKQFHDCYTNAIFKLFQNELQGMLFCNHSLFKQDGTISIYHVTDVVDKKYEKCKRKVVYDVSYNEVGCDIKCSCHLFEFRGIVCRHMMKILIEKEIKELPSRYILSRWRKDLKHRHYYVTSCYEDLKNEEQAKQFNHLCSDFYEAAHIANSREKYEYLIKCIQVAKEKLNHDTSWVLTSNKVVMCEDVQCGPNPAAKLLSPSKVRGKGRPPSKRNESIVCDGKKDKVQDQRNSSLSDIRADKGTSSSSKDGRTFISDTMFPSTYYSFDLNH
uniref:protein FAR1-RELATED SEQUENCE 6-like n=1 Tax=Erigeron canadensis TaxID=72917 RepID=UPI001CB9B974|nr:protein FAR1-RELATED SEQUENCE 6-like [Erigeron canadensis]